MSICFSLIVAASVSQGIILIAESRPRGVTVLQRVRKEVHCRIVQHHLQAIAACAERAMVEISADDLMVGPRQRMALERILSVTFTQAAIG